MRAFIKHKKDIEVHITRHSSHCFSAYLDDGFKIHHFDVFMYKDECFDVIKTYMSVTYKDVSQFYIFVKD